LKFSSSDTYNFLKSKLIRSLVYSLWTLCEQWPRFDTIILICFSSKRCWPTCQGEEVGNVCCLLVNFKAGRATSEWTVAIQRSDCCYMVWNSNVVRSFTSCLLLYGMLWNWHFPV